MGPLEEDKELYSVDVNCWETGAFLEGFSVENHPVFALPVLCVRFHPGQQVAMKEMHI